MSAMMFWIGLLATTLAHISPTGTAIDGFLHPLLGFDHLLAMITVGLLSAQIGGRAIWSVPATFVTVMAVSGVLGYLNVPLPYVEYGIAASVILLGASLLSNRRVPEALAVGLVALFSVFHGHAHGAELHGARTIIDVIAYVLGFMVATAGLHVIGALLGYIALRSPRGAQVLRYSGVLIALVGVYLVASI
ncbi:MAG: HupE/UreJ family protein [Anaerolineales bacterium]